MRKFRRTTLLTGGCVAVLTGIGLARLSQTGLESYWWLASLVVLTIVFWQRRLLAFAVIVFFGLVLGWWQGGNMLNKLDQYEQLYGKPVTILVKADSDGTYTDKSQIIFDASHARVVEPLIADLPGRLTISGFGTSDIRRGDILKVEGKMFPIRGGRQARISFAKLEVELRSSSIIEKIRREFLAGLRSILPEPQASFGAGLLIGGTRDLPESNVEALRLVGLSHIIAVSGYNLTILAEVFGSRAGKRSKFRGLVLSVLMISVFVLLAGTSASIARAALVAILTQVARYFGRNFRPVMLLAGVAAFSAFTNPLNLWTDIGWYLSFLAFYGVLVLAPLIQKRFFEGKRESLIRDIIIESSCAQIMTVPYVLFIFSQVSLISLVANLLVIPFIPLAMLLIAAAGIAWLVLPWATIALWLAWPANILLTFMLDVANLLSRVPNASVERSLGLGAMIFCYGVIVFLSINLATNNRGRVKIAA